MIVATYMMLPSHHGRTSVFYEVKLAKRDSSAFSLRFGTLLLVGAFLFQQRPVMGANHTGWPSSSSSVRRIVSSSPGSLTRSFLDTMSTQMQGSAAWSDSTWNRTFSCIKNGSRFIYGNEQAILKSSDASWQGLIEYARAGGALDGSDPWNNQQEFIEWNKTSMDPNNQSGWPDIIIGEPCNTISNIVYYRTMFALCENADAFASLGENYTNGLIQAITNLAMGSSLLHASQTDLGTLTDDTPIGIMSWMAHQASLQTLPYNSVLHDLSNQSSPLTSIQLSSTLIALSLETPVQQWADTIKSWVFPRYEYSLAGMIVTVFHLIFPKRIASALFRVLGSALLDSDQLAFIETQYEPTLQQVLDSLNIRLSWRNKRQLSRRFFGMFVKQLFAMAWNEYVFPITGYLYRKHANKRAVRIMPRINWICNKWTGYDRSSDVGMQKCVDVYPSDTQCRYLSPHSRWHEMSGNGLVDLFLVVRDVNILLSGGDLTHNDEASTTTASLLFSTWSGFDLWGCMARNDGWLGWEDTFLREARTDDFSGAELIIEQCITDSINSLPDTSWVTLIKCLFELNYEGGQVDNLENCLIQNKCLSLGWNGLINTNRLAGCIYQPLSTMRWTIRSRPPCAKYMNDSMAAHTCLAGCGGDIICSLVCLGKHARTLASTTQQVTTCLTRVNLQNAKIAPSSSIQDYLTCFSDMTNNKADSSAVTAWKGLIPMVVSSSSQQMCRTSSLGRLTQLETIIGCTTKCQANRLFYPTLQYIKGLPRAVACFAECFFLPS